MATCLVTKLKASVSGDFPILGGTRLFLEKNRFSPNNPLINMGGVPNEVELEFVNTTLASGGTTLVLSKNLQDIFINDPGEPIEVIVNNSSFLTAILDLYNVAGGFNNIPASNLTQLSLSLGSILNFDDIEDVSFPKLTKFEVFSGTNNLTGDPSKIFSKLEPSVFTTLKFLAAKTTEFDIASLGHLTKIAAMDISDAPAVGTVESFVAAQRTAGRTTCDGIQCGYLMGTKVTFNNATIPTGNYAAKTLSWTATTITLGDVTINA